MAARNPPSPYKLRSVVALLHQYYRVRANAGGPCRSYKTGSWGQLSNRFSDGYPTADRGLRQVISGYTQSSNDRKPNHGDRLPKGTAMVASQNGLNPASPGFGIFTWLKWLFGSLLAFLPLGKQKWDRFLTFEGEVEQVVEEVEEVAEVVEKVATVAETVIAQVAENLPKDSKLKEAALVAEHVTAEVAKDAELTTKLIHKVGDLKQDVEDLRTMVEPVIDKIVELESRKK